MLPASRVDEASFDNGYLPKCRTAVTCASEIFFFILFLSSFVVVGVIIPPPPCKLLPIPLLLFPSRVNKLRSLLIFFLVGVVGDGATMDGAVGACRPHGKPPSAATPPPSPLSSPPLCSPA